MKQLLFEIKTRLGKNFLSTIWSLLKLYIIKLRHADFIMNRNNEVIDVVIPTTDKDFELLSLVIESLKNVGNKINKIYIVAPAKETIINLCQKNNILFTNELKVLGFGKESLKNYMVNGIDRRGWLFQQFLKYGMKDFVEQENYVVLDSDTVLINTNTFLENNKFIFFKNSEWHKPYFSVFNKIFGYKNKSYTSFTSHMMIFNKKYLDEMLLEIEIKNKGKWYNIIQDLINKKEMSAISDYENYGQWMFIKHKDLIIEKPLYNQSLNRKSLTSFESLRNKYKNGYNTLSFHNWVK